MSRGLVLLLTQVLRYKAAPASGLWGTHLLCLRLWTGASAFPSPGQKAGRMRGRRTELQVHTQTCTLCPQRRPEPGWLGSWAVTRPHSWASPLPVLPSHTQGAPPRPDPGAGELPGCSAHDRPMLFLECQPGQAVF